MFFPLRAINPPSDDPLSFPLSDHFQRRRLNKSLQNSLPDNQRLIEIVGLTLLLMLASFKRLVLLFVCVMFHITCCCQIQGRTDGPDSDSNEVLTPKLSRHRKLLAILNHAVELHWHSPHVRCGE